MAADKAPRKLKHKTIRPDLSLPEIRFCKIYVDNKGNGIQAWRDADFPGPPPASENATSKRVWLLLRKPQIGEYIRELRNDACEAATITVESLAKSFKEQAHADRTLIFDEQGRMTNPRTWPKELRSIIAGIEVDNIEEWVTVDGERVKQVVGQNWKVKFERSTEAKKILAQWKGMIGNDKTPISADSTPMVVGGDADVGNL